MACFHPWKAYRKRPDKDGKGGITQDSRLAINSTHQVTLPCGQCIGCRMDRSKDWATRITHEASLHKANAFVTLTYADAHLPLDLSVSVEAVQKFMKRLRRASGRGIRFFACGEYGERNWRPHYHLAIFGTDWISDRYAWRRSSSGELLYRSPALESHWPFGHSEIGTLTTASAGYVARYIMKKVGGEQALEHYKRVHPLTGEVVQCRPEFITMSNKPGLGGEWYDRFKGDAFPSDFVIVEGERRSIPRYYTKKLVAESALAALVVKGARAARANRQADNNTPDRLAVRETVQILKAERLVRELENA